MILGTYEIYLDAVASVNIVVLFPMGVGLVLGGFLFLKLTQYLIEKYYPQTYYTIIGFVLGSLFVLYPGFQFNLVGFSSLVIFIICFYIGKTFETKGEH